MNTQKIVKFNLIMSGILFSAAVLMFISVTIAWFSDTKKVDATFTSGNVKIALTEAAVKPDASGNLVEDKDEPRIFGAADENVLHNYGRVYPGMSIYKDPTVKNIGDVPEWIAVKVTIDDGAGDIHKLIGYGGYDDIDIEQLLTGGLLDERVSVGTWNGIENVCHNENYAMIQVANKAEGKYEFYFLMLKPVAPEESVKIFEQVVFNRMWNNADMQQLAGLKIHVQAYGVQTYQLNSCFQAMTEAFPSHFPFASDIK